VEGRGRGGRLPVAREDLMSEQRVCTGLGRDGRRESVEIL
jgi:hypothetical protein